MPEQKETASYEIARFATRLKYEDLAQPVVRKAKELILDQLGIQVAASTLPWCQAVYNYVRDIGSPGSATILNYGLPTRSEFAAMANATFGHGFELDDWYPPASGHPGCVIVPTVLALGEETGASGRDVILNVVIGYEALLGVAEAGGPSLKIHRGFHETSVEGVIGAAAAAGRMLGLDEAQMVNALGIAASQASGTLEYSVSGGAVKRFHAGLGAAGGIRSALLARMGLTAPPTALEGRRGLLQAYCETYDAGKLTEGLGEKYKILDVATRLGACPISMNIVTEGVSSLLKAHGLAPGDIEDIEVGTYAIAQWKIGSSGSRPRDATQAQYSVQFGIGLNVVKGGNTFQVYKDQMDKDFDDPEVIAMAEKVRLVVDGEAERLYQSQNKKIARIKVRTGDGQIFQTIASTHKGMRESPVSSEELADKFRGLASPVLPRSNVEEVVRIVDGLEKLERVSELTQLLVSPTHRAASPPSPAQHSWA